MPSTTGALWNVRRIAIVVVIASLSFVLPIGVICGFVYSAASGKPLGEPSNVFKRYFHGCVKNDQLWFITETRSGRLFDRSFEVRVHRLDLTTGVESPTDARMIGKDLTPICWVGEELYFWHGSHGDNGIYKTDGSSFESAGTWTQNTKALHSWPFAYNGTLTRVHETDDGEFVLHHLIDGEWKDGRKVVLPGFGWYWRANEIPKGLGLAVIQNERELHLLLQDANGLFLYRREFPFVGETIEAVSALEPANSEPRVAEWEPVPETVKGLDFVSMNWDSHGAFLFAAHPSPRFVWRMKEGHWGSPSRIDVAINGDNQYFQAVSSSGQAVILDNDWKWQSLKVHRVAGDTILPPHLKLPGNQFEYFLRVLRLIGGLICAWLLHLAIVVVGADWLTREADRSTYWFGSQSATLASTTRRAFALALDLLLMLSVMLALLCVQLPFFGIVWNWPTTLDVCNWTFAIEQDLALYGPRNGESVVDRIHRLLFASRCNPFEYTALIIFLGVQGLAIWCVRLHFEGRYGVTPGNWLFGIRTLRATLRPCGFGRALVRTMLYWIDIPLFITPWPAVLSMLSSPHRQRLGDRVADTIVVLKNPTQETD